MNLSFSHSPSTSGTSYSEVPGQITLICGITWTINTLTMNNWLLQIVHPRARARLREARSFSACIAALRRCPDVPFTSIIIYVAMPKESYESNRLLLQFPKNLFAISCLISCSEPSSEPTSTSKHECYNIFKIMTRRPLHS